MGRSLPADPSDAAVETGKLIPLSATRRPPAWLRPVMVCLAASGLSQGLGRLTLGFVLPDMVPDVLDDYLAAGILGGINLLAYFLSVVSMIRLSREFSAVSLLRAGVVLSTAGMLLMGLAGSFAVLAVGVTALGFGSGVAWIACVPIVSDAAPTHRRGLAFGIMHSGIGLSTLIISAASTLAHSVFGAGSWRSVWLIEAGVGVAICGFVWLCLARPAPVAKTEATTPRAPSTVFSTNLRWLLVGYGLFGLVHALYITFLVAALQLDAGLSVGQSASVYTALGLLNIAGGVTLGRASDAVGRRAILIASLLAMAVTAIVIPNASSTIALASGALYGLLMSGFSTVVIAYLGDVSSPQSVAPNYSIITAAVGVGQLIGPPLGGALADTSGSFTSTYATAAGVALVGAAAMTRLARPGGRRRHG